MFTYEEQEGINRSLSKGETFLRAYRAFEGDVRVISIDRNGVEHRYTSWRDENGTIYLKAM